MASNALLVTSTLLSTELNGTELNNAQNDILRSAKC